MERIRNLFGALRSNALEKAKGPKIENFGTDLGSRRRSQKPQLDPANTDRATAVTSKMLQVKNPNTFHEALAPDHIRAPLAMHFAMQHFPKEPMLGPRASQAARAGQSHMQFGSDEAGIPMDHVRATAKQAYADAYASVRAKAHELAHSSNHSQNDALNDLTDHIRNLSDKYAGDPATSGVAQGLLDCYHAIHPWARSQKATKAVNEVDGYGRRKYGPTPFVAAPNQMMEHAREIMGGKKTAEAFGEQKEKVKREPKKLAVSDIKREGPDFGMTDPDKQQRFLLDHAKIKGFDWGKSTSQKERLHHLEQGAHALRDMADAIGLPHSMISYNGRLGLAVGSRGGKGALAHYERGSRIINLSRDKGMGSLAHEWAHLFDNVLSDVSEKKPMGFTSASAKKDSQDPVHRAMAGVTGFLQSKVASRIKADAAKPEHSHMSRSNLHNYWLTPHEMFARAFETYMHKKLAKQGRKNGYLVKDEDKHHWLMPTKEEQDELEPLFDNLFDEFKKSPHLMKNLAAQLQRMAKSLRV